MPSKDSLWIDEGTTAHYATQENFSAFIDLLKREKGSESQMPAGMLSAWIGGRILGTGSEWILRAQNIAWTALTVFFAWRIGLLTGAPWLALVIAIHPFTWVYTNEFRPYAMQMAAGSILALAATEAHLLADKPLKYVTHALAGGFLVSSASMLGLFTALPSIACIGIMRRKEVRENINTLLPSIILFLAIFSILGVYYAWTLLGGAGGSKLWQLSIGNVALAVYETLGFTGLGPGRIALRDALKTAHTLSPLREHILLLGLLALCYGGIAIRWALDVIKSRSIRLCDLFLAIFAASLLLLFLASAVAGFPFWGRHMAGAVPFIAIATALMLKDAVARSRTAAILAIALTLLMTCSSLMARYSPEHKRDDYKNASAIAIAACGEGKSVWWAGAPLPAAYYGLSFSGESTARLTINEKAEDLGVLVRPSMIVTSKPDIFDANGELIRYCKEYQYRILHELNAFRIYTIETEELSL